MRIVPEGLVASEADQPNDESPHFNRKEDGNFLPFFMNIELIKQRKKEIIERYGSWTTHNIQLEGDIYTIDKRIVSDEIKLRRIVEIVADVAGEPLENLRVLDLACLEGLYAIELARHGAKAVAIEGREANIEKARFTKDVLSLDNLELIKDDVRNLSKEKYGYFDVVLCLGILYHLDVPDLFHFMEKIAEVCQRFTVIDTYISLSDKESHVYKGREYWGRPYIEYSANASAEEKANALWSSLDNPRSFWITRPSLYNLLSEVGFTSVYECHNPPILSQPYDRITLLAIKGRRENLISSPLVNELPKDAWPEKQRKEIHPIQKRYYSIERRLSQLLPKPIKEIMKRLLPKRKT